LVVIWQLIEWLIANPPYLFVAILLSLLAIVPWKKDER
jgi:hypothetical protein